MGGKERGREGTGNLQAWYLAGYACGGEEVHKSPKPFFSRFIVVFLG